MISPMRTIIELPKDQIAALDQMRRRDKLSRAALIRKAIEAYLESQPKASLRDLPSFGAWKKKAIEGVKYQRHLRAEWE